MSHIHIPDGVIPVVWWLLGLLIAGAAVAFALKLNSGRAARKRLPMLGTIAAVMLIGMSIPLGFIPYHLTFSVLAGILLGPSLGFLAAFIANIFLALMGHGGITVIGLNALTVGSEAVTGGLLYRAFRRLRLPVPAAAAAACVFALTISFALSVGIVALVGIDPALLIKELAEKSAAVKPVTGAVSVSRFVSIALPLALPGIIIEAGVVAAAAGFIARVKPRLLGEA